MAPLFARVCILLALTCDGTVLAQSGAIPDPTPEIRRQELRQEQLRREQETKPSVRLSAQALPAGKRLPHEETCRSINEVVFQGLPALDAQLNGRRLSDRAMRGGAGHCCAD
jgi:hemolysin activation/secretion protein